MRNLMRALSIKYGQGIEFSSNKIAQADHVCMQYCISYFAACISTFKNSYCREVSMLDMHLTHMVIQ